LQWNQYKKVGDGDDVDGSGWWRFVLWRWNGIFMVLCSSDDLGVFKINTQFDKAVSQTHGRVKPYEAGLAIPMLIKSRAACLRGMIDLGIILARDSSLIGSDFLLKVPISA
jgi:hypothetical protein